MGRGDRRLKMPVIMTSTSIADVNRNVKKVLIVDDHPAVREGLVMRLAREADLEVCGEAADQAEALQLVEREHPDVMVVDIHLQEGNGIDLVKSVRARGEATRILVWSMYADMLYAERALRAGASGYINKSQQTSRIVEAIRTVLDGKVFLSDDSADRLLQISLADRGRSGDSVASQLSDREMQVFNLIGEGLTTKQIADRLHRSVHTIETHRQRIKGKLKLETSAELARAAARWVLENS